MKYDEERGQVRCGFLILAAGKGTRMHSAAPKVLQTLLGKPLLGYVYDALRSENGTPVWTVVGFEAERIVQRFGGGTRFIHQHEQLGTGHAVRMAWPEIVAAGVEFLFVLNGDTPHVPVGALVSLARHCRTASAAMGFLTVRLDDPTGYGRVLRSPEGDVLRIVEEKDFDRAACGEVHEVNAGMYVLNVSQCTQALTRLDTKNAQKEMYITQLVDLVLQEGRTVLGERHPDAENVQGINSPRELTRAEDRLRARIVDAWIDAGVIIRNRHMVSIGPDVELEAGCEICGPCEIYGKSVVSRGTVIESHCWIADATLHSCQVKSFSHIVSAVVESGAVVGPYARLRPGTRVGEDARIGNFVEVKKTILGVGAKASHLTYLGDSEIGAGVNIGAGTITCNYDGKAKHRTQVQDGAFIGSNTALVAPVVIGAGALVGAGSVVTKDVPPGELCVARAKQVHYQRKHAGKTPEE